MALSRKQFTEIPPDAVVLTEHEALKYQSKILNKWQHTSDVFAYKYGIYALGFSSFLSGLYINAHYRSKFKLRQYGKVSMYLPLCVLPAAFSAVTHLEFVQRDVLLQKRDACPVCLEMRGSALQAMVGCVFPALLAPIASLGLAQKYSTYNVPDITQEPMKVLRLVKKVKTPIYNTLVAIFVGQALMGSAVTYLEAKSVSTVNQKLDLLERQLENM